MNNIPHYYHSTTVTVIIVINSLQQLLDIGLIIVVNQLHLNFQPFSQFTYSKTVTQSCVCRTIYFCTL